MMVVVAKQRHCHGLLLHHMSCSHGNVYVRIGICTGRLSCVHTAAVLDIIFLHCNRKRCQNRISVDSNMEERWDKVQGFFENYYRKLSHLMYVNLGFVLLM